MSRPQPKAQSVNTRPLPTGTVNVPVNMTETFRADIDVAATESDNMSRGGYIKAVLEIALSKKWRFKKGKAVFVDGSSEAEQIAERDANNRLAEVTARVEKTLSAKRKNPSKNKRARLRQEVLDLVNFYVLGKPSCGKLAPAEQQYIKTVRVPAGKYPPDAYGLIADGDSMNRAKLPGGRIGIKPGDIIVCRSLEHERAETGKIVVAECDGDTCVKGLAEDEGGPYLQPESSNRKHKPFRVPAHATVQAVVIDKL